MKLVVTYTSKTGFTRRYAQWIAEELGHEAVPQKQLKNASEYDLLIHGGWIMGGMLTGFADIRKQNPKSAIVFGVGQTEDEGYVETIREANQLGEIPCFYFPGGYDPSKLNFFLKFIVKTVTKKKPEYEDHTNREAIKQALSIV